MPKAIDQSLISKFNISLQPGNLKSLLSYLTTAIPSVVSATSTCSPASMCDSSVTVRSTTMNFTMSIEPYFDFTKLKDSTLDVSTSLNVFTD